MEAATPGPSAIHWDRERIKALLCAPQQLLQAEPWATWLRDRGGLAAVYAELRSYPLAKRQRATLGALLDSPGMTAQQYADQLDVDSTTFFRYRMSLLETLQIYLNAAQPQKSALSSPATGARPAAPITSLVGRQHELQLIGALLRDPEIRLVNLVGPGGVGKTRLALEVIQRLAAEYRDGVCFVDLAALEEAVAVPAALAQGLGLVAEPGMAPLDLLVAHLRDKHLLLAIDTFERQIEAATLLATLIEAAPQIDVLVTSRVRLHHTYEHLVDVPPLALPDPAAMPSFDSLGDYDAILLFVERAGAVQAGFAIDEANATVVVEICRRLDGLPLAIELAAGRIRHGSLSMMRQRLQNRLAFLTSSAPDRPSRHQSLRAAFDWSYDRLDAREQRVLRCLGIFDGGCTLPMIEALITALDERAQHTLFDVLGALVDKSLVRLVEEDDGEVRYGLLETLRDYALERLHEHADVERVAPSEPLQGRILQEAFAKLAH